MTPDLAHVAVAIRSAGERTAEACRLRVESQLPAGAAVEVICERPFERALRRCYEFGAASGADWLVTIDADVLLGDGALRTLVAHAERLPRRGFSTRGLVHDRILGFARYAGLRAYRTALLPEALHHLQPERTCIRPEADVVYAMQRHGRPSIKLDNLLLGLHDYEQYYRDLYRKARVHAVKHVHHLGLLVARCQARAANAEFRVVLRGICDGLTATAEPRIDVRDFAEAGERALRELGLAERGALAAEGPDGEFVQEVLAREQAALRHGFARHAARTVGRLLQRVSHAALRYADAGRA